MVLRAGGTAVRPDMVVGVGDQWFVPAFIRFVEAVGGLVDHGSALMSMIRVTDLAAIVTRISLAEQPIVGAFNASYSEPSSVSDLAALLGPITGWPSPLPSLRRSEALPMALGSRFSARQFELLTTDHWYANAALNAAIGADWASGLSLTGQDLDWYRSQLR